MYLILYQPNTWHNNTMIELSDNENCKNEETTMVMPVIANEPVKVLFRPKKLSNGAMTT